MVVGLLICLTGIGCEVPHAEWLRDRLAEKFGARVMLIKGVGLESALLDTCRMQYRADGFLDLLARMRVHCDKLIGITEEDMFVPDLNYVFGLSSTGGRECVVSTARLRPDAYGRAKGDDIFRERLLKEAMHELGHSMGLVHCENACVMRFSNSISDVDAKPAKFCWECGERLAKRGAPEGLSNKS